MEMAEFFNKELLYCLSWNGTEGRNNTFDDGVLWLLDQIDKFPTIKMSFEKENLMKFAKTYEGD